MVGWSEMHLFLGDGIMLDFLDNAVSQIHKWDISYFFTKYEKLLQLF